MAGGRAKRMGIDIPKCMLEISGKKLIDICIESLQKEGFSDFVFLLGHKHEMVTQHLGDGTRYGINAKFSIDPPSVLGWGKGKAFKYALETNKIDKSKRCIIVFPDDLVLEEKVFSKVLVHHIEAIRKNDVSASTLLVPGTEYPYGVADVSSDGTVLEFKEKPFLDKPTSVGVYVFEPKVYDIISKRISLEDPKPVDLESTIMPYLVNERKLTGLFIPSDKWVPVNTMKEYEQAVKILSLQR
jgi:NDP-sugar pyrophosphorylase family protein